MSIQVYLNRLPVSDISIHVEENVFKCLIRYHGNVSPSPSLSLPYIHYLARTVIEKSLTKYNTIKKNKFVLCKTSLGSKYRSLFTAHTKKQIIIF